MPKELQPLSVETICNTLARSGLLAADAVRDVHGRWLRLQAGTAAADVPAFVQWLVKYKMVTSYQGDVLLRRREGPLTLGSYKIIDRIHRGAWPASIWPALQMARPWPPRCCRRPVPPTRKSWPGSSVSAQHHQAGPPELYPRFRGRTGQVYLLHHHGVPRRRYAGRRSAAPRPIARRRSGSAGLSGTARATAHSRARNDPPRSGTGQPDAHCQRPSDRGYDLELHGQDS